jgi:hypothetical protein
METSAPNTYMDWWVVYRTADDRKWRTLSYHDTKYDANRAAMQAMFGVVGVDVVCVHRDDLELYLGDNANA